MGEEVKMKADAMEKLPILGVQPRDDKEKKFLQEMCEYEFYNLEEPGLLQSFPYGSTNNKMDFKFLHGGKYRVPRHVARHIEDRHTPIWEWRPDGTGAMKKQKTGVKPRFQMRQVYA